MRFFQTNVILVSLAVFLSVASGYAQPIHTTGNTNSDLVGIGIATPSAKLHVSDFNLGSTPAVTIEGTDSENPNGFRLFIQGSEGGSVPHTQITTGTPASRFTLKCASSTDKAPRLQMTGPLDPSSPGWAVFDYGSREQLLTDASFKMRWMPGNANDPAVDMIHADGQTGVYLVPVQGNVGVGTSSPQELLHVAGAVRSDDLAGTGTRNVMADDNGNLIIGTTASTPSDLNDLNDVNASSPTTGYVLAFDGSNWVPTPDEVDDADHDAGNELNNTLSLNGTSLELTDGGGTLSVDLSSLSGGTGGGSDHDWYVANGSSAPTNISDNIYTSGKVGIGTSNPIAPLHIGENKTALFGADTLGSGTKMMWVPQKHAFRSGFVSNTNWDPTNIGTYSFAAGNNPKASGNTAIAFGNNANAQGDYSIALGNATNALASYSVSIGRSTTANGQSAIAMGLFTQANGSYSTSFGLASQANGYISTALGSSTIASGSYSTALGNFTTASGDNSIAGGNQNTAAGPSSIALGANNNALGTASVTLGSNNLANDFYSVALGYLNQATSTGAVALGRETEAQNSYTIAMGYRTVASGATAISMGSSTEASGDYSTAMGFFTNTSYNALAIGKYNDDDGARNTWDPQEYIMTIGDGTSTANRSNCMYVKKNGDMWVQGTISQSSDLRLKKNITYLDNALDKTLQLNGISYDWKKAEEYGSNRQIGLIAQEVEEVFPELVTEVEGYKAVNYSAMVPVLVEAIKEQHTEASINEKQDQEQQAEIDRLKQENEILKSRLSAIEAQMNKLDQFEQDLQNCCFQSNTTSPISPTNTTEIPSLSQNAPNPFHQNTRIQYYIPSKIQQAQLQISDLNGNTLKVFPIDSRGFGTTQINGGELSNGIYLYSLILDGTSFDSKKMVLTK